MVNISLLIFMRIILFVLLIFAASLFTSAQNKNLTTQNKKSDNSLKLNQNAISIIGLNFGDQLNKEVINNLTKLKIPDKFIDISLNENIIQSNIPRTKILDTNNILDDQELIHLLNENKIGQQVLSNWFNRQIDSSFNLEILEKRASIKTNEQDFLKAAASKKCKLKLMEMGLRMVNQSYLLLFDFQDVKTMEAYYNQTGVDEENRIMNGYIADFNSYLIKLDFNSSVASVFFNDFWVTENDLNKHEKIEAFKNTEFPFIVIKTFNNKITSTQHNKGQLLAQEKQKTTDELLDDFAHLALNKVFADIEKQNEPFKLKTMIREVKPISAKIGKKGGLKFDQRYFVYENHIHKNGTIYPKRIGVVKSKKIIDNRQNSLIQTQNSAFYQIAGGAIHNGMFLEERKDLGLNLFIENTFSGLPGINGRVEYYFSRMFDDVISPGKTATGSTSFKIYLSGGYNQKLYRIDEHILNHTFVRGSFGVSKDFYPLRFLHWGPYLGYGLESITREGTKNIVSSNFTEMGLRLGINLIYNIQLIASYNYYHFFNSILLDENKDVVNENFNYFGTYKDRSSSGFSLGLRIML